MSATISTAVPVLKAVAAVSLEEGVAFKFACDLQMLIIINSRGWNRAAAGKFITVYPRSEGEFESIIERLYVSLRGFAGPYIFSDRRYKDCKSLFYRYGGITPLKSLRSDGTAAPTLISPEGYKVADARFPYFSPPAWAPDPFPSNEDTAEKLTLKNGRYAVTDVLSFTNAGGVYVALDAETGDRVVIKEARPYTAFDASGRDAIALRRNEWNLLNKLRDTGIVVQPLDLFWDWEHLFLVERHVPGLTIDTFVPQYNPMVLFDDPSDHQLQQYYEKVLIIGANIARAMHIVHNRGVLLADLSPRNILVDPTELTVTIVDLEGAVDVSTGGQASLWTLGFASKGLRSRREPRFADDYYALGNILLSLLWPIQAITDVKPGAPREFLSELEQDYGIPTSLISTTVSLLDDADEKRPRPEVVAEALATARPSARKLAEPRDASRRRMEEILGGIPTFIASAASPGRNDRLFPSSYGSVNPVCISTGALGVAYALRKLTGDVPKEYLDWILRHYVPSEAYAPGLYVGLSGIAWALSELGLHDEGADALDAAKNHGLLFESSDLYYGVSGFGLTCLHFWVRTQEKRFLNDALDVGEWLLKTRVEHERVCHWPGPEGRIHLGYAEGSSGVALFLLYLYLATGESRFLDVGRRAINFDSTYAVPQAEGEHHMSLLRSTSSKVRSPYWFAGTAGFATSLLRYVVVTQDRKLRIALEAVSPDACRKYTLWPGLFNGLAGLGNYLLDCHQLLGYDSYLRQAHRVAEGILLYAIDRPGGAAFPGDALYRISTDFGTGSAGVGLFLHRLLRGGGNFNFLVDELLPTVSSGDRRQADNADN